MTPRHKRRAGRSPRALQLRDANPRQYVRRHHRRSGEHRAIGKVVSRSTRHASRFDNRRISSTIASPQETAERLRNDNHVASHVMEEEPFDFVGVNGISNRGTYPSDERSLSPVNVPDRNISANDRGKENDVTPRELKEERFKNTGVSGARDAYHLAEHHKPLFWSVLRKTTDRMEISKSEEDEMLRLSQSSTSEEPTFEQPSSEVNISSPKRRKKQKSGILKRPRSSSMNGPSNIVDDIPHANSGSPDKLQVAEQRIKHSKRVRSQASSQACRDLEDEEPSPSERSKEKKDVRNYDTAVAEQYFAGDGEQRNRDVAEEVRSAEPLNNIVITVHCVDVPENKRNKPEQEQRHDIDGGISTVADPSNAQACSPSSSIPKEKTTQKTKNAASSAGEDDCREETLHSSHDSQDTDACKPDRLQRNGDFVRFKNSLANTRGFSGREKMKKNAADTKDSPPRRVKKENAMDTKDSPSRRAKKEHAMDTKDSPSRRGKKSKRRDKRGLVANESSMQKPISPTGEEGYQLSKGMLQLGLELRQQLLGCRDNINDHAISKGAEGRVESSEMEKRRGEARTEQNSVHNDSKEKLQQQTGEKLRRKEKELTSLGLERTTVERETSNGPPESEMLIRDRGRNGNPNFPPSQLNQGIEDRKCRSAEAKEKMLTSPDRGVDHKRRKREKRIAASRDQADANMQKVDAKSVNKYEERKSNSEGTKITQRMPAKHNSPKAQPSTSAVVERGRRQNGKNPNVLAKRWLLKDSKGNWYAEVQDDAPTADGQRLIPKLAQATTDAEMMQEQSNRQKAYHGSDLTETPAAQKTAAELRSKSNPHECVQTAVENASRKFPGPSQRSMTEGGTEVFTCETRVPGDGEKNTTEPSSAGRNSLLPKRTVLESAPSAQSFDIERTDRKHESESKELQQSSQLDRVFSIPGSSPGDLSSRVRRRTLRRRFGEIPGILPLLTPHRPSQKERGILQKEKNTKSPAPSSILKVSSGCHSVKRLATHPLPVDVSENDVQQPRNREVSSEQERKKCDSVRVIKAEEFDAEEFDDWLQGTSEEDELSKHDRISEGIVEVKENAVFEEKRSLNGSIPGVTARHTRTKETRLKKKKKLDSRHEQVTKPSTEQNLDELVDPKELRKQSELLTKRSRGSKRSRVGGARRDRSKALDELSDNEDPKDEAWVPKNPPSAQSGSRSKRVSKAESQKTHHMKTRRRASTSARIPLEGSAIVDLTDIGDDDNTVVDKRKSEDDDAIAESLRQLQELSLEDKTKGISERPGCKYLAPLTDDESKLCTDLTTRTKMDTRIVTIAEAGITLLGESFKRLRGTRWLDDEILNAYVSLINSRNDAIFHEMEEEHRIGIPRTYVFNTYFFTRLCSGCSGFDYPGVQGWTKRAKVDILKRDIILIPINLGNHHWVLSGVDMEHKEVMYMDSMHGPDIAGVLSKLKRWVFEELRHKHGEEVAEKHDPKSWKEVKHSYRIRRVGVLPEELEPRDGATAGREAKVPEQKDGGSCGVFTAKMADCLSLGIKVYFKQRDIHLIRRRMALDLFRGYIPL